MEMSKLWGIWALKSCRQPKPSSDKTLVNNSNPSLECSHSTWIREVRPHLLLDQSKTWFHQIKSPQMCEEGPCFRPHRRPRKTPCCNTIHLARIWWWWRHRVESTWFIRQPRVLKPPRGFWRKTNTSMAPRETWEVLQAFALLRLCQPTESRTSKWRILCWRAQYLPDQWVAKLT